MLCQFVVTCSFQLFVFLAARLGQLREDLDVNLTWEGDNNVLVLQTGAYLLGVYEKKVRESPLHSIDFIGQFDFSQFEHSARTSKASFANLFTITNLVNKSLDKYFLVQVMQYATCYRLWKYAKKVESLVASGLSKKEARLMTQAFYSKSVAINYIEVSVHFCCLVHITALQTQPKPIAFALHFFAFTFIFTLVFSSKRNTYFGIDFEEMRKNFM